MLFHFPCFPLNSLCGISSNATRIASYDFEQLVVAKLSQFPLWDFFECNLMSRERRLKFLIFASQFPLWDFFECNGIVVDTREAKIHNDLSIPFVGFLRMQQTASLSSSVALLSCSDSQFPLWDFFECNLGFPRSGKSTWLSLSIPFVGFLRMQP